MAYPRGYEIKPCVVKLEVDFEFSLCGYRFHQRLSYDLQEYMSYLTVADVVYGFK